MLNVVSDKSSRPPSSEAACAVRRTSGSIEENCRFAIWVSFSLCDAIVLSKVPVWRVPQSALHFREDLHRLERGAIERREKIRRPLAEEGSATHRIIATPTLKRAGRQSPARVKPAGEDDGQALNFAKGHIIL